ncbi:TIGR01244 family sulfur transferase [Devosia sp. YIM 151766]|uniref:TIGR01244 family sulfur transferase n=1 Tax=Devosia sp. YIM 151766 TaxID=3017325 RepID=UPI00255C2CD0|nr:TIGR01244 family sulfur transferase [Devosia sp. YIM 151766]WIY52675.1 TIGR01244 family sulfur transferase [Devosia sp. YIM 151766]
MMTARRRGELHPGDAGGYNGAANAHPDTRSSALELKRINDHVSVSGQIQPEDVATLKALGFVTIVNNRPDGEAPDQPAGAEIEAAAKAAGLGYAAIPLGREGVTPDLVRETKAALEGSDGPVLCYCRSGTRSTTLWALSQAGDVPVEDIITQAAEAGYDMSHLAGHLGRT